MALALQNGILFGVRSGTGGSGGSSTGGGATKASEISVNTSGMKVIKSTNAQGALGHLDAELSQASETAGIALQAVAKYTTTKDLSATVGDVVELKKNDLTSVSLLGVNVEPSVGAIVFGNEGVIGIIAATSNGNITVQTVSCFNAMSVTEV